MVYGENMSQHDFMQQDETLVVDYNDNLVGAENKYNTHKFIPGQPKGVCHRAFSIMLFDNQNRMLLQQRAACKVTFPRVWTNTCCSHPLHGQTPDEVDRTPREAPRAKEPDGIFNAARRKLLHELGITPKALEGARFKYMGRVHYWAADVLTHGPDAPWGEHEIDYLVLVRLPCAAADFTMAPNDEEVMDVAWVTSEELAGAAWMASPTLLWSPWFRVIARELLFGWWDNLDAAWRLKPYERIRRFDAPPEHCKAGGLHSGEAARELGGLTDAEAPLEWNSPERRALALRWEREARRRDLTSSARSSASAKANKQGAYGKVPTHGHSVLDQLRRPSEVLAALTLKFGGGGLRNNLAVPADSLADDVAFCDRILGDVSRSFAAVIRQLPRDMVLDILLFYLVLRALDTIEDDMEAFKGDEASKCKHLRAFGDDYLGNESWRLEGVGEGAEAELLERFGAVSRVFNALPEASREVIRDITRRMGAGMADQVGVDMGQGTKDLAAYNLYCHAVAGLVGEGLTRSFIARGFETDAIAGQGRMVWPFCAPADKVRSNYGIANSMGLFLQKTNIIRDYLEDYADGRAFWPGSEWRRFSRTDDLGEFARPTAHGAGVYSGAYDAKADPAGAKIVGKGARTSALACLNFLVGDALELVPDCLDYLAKLRTPEVFRFSAIPQAMAIATLEACFDNPLVFTGVVKIRKGTAAKLILASSDMSDVLASFTDYATEIKRRCPVDDPSRTKIVSACDEILRYAAAAKPRRSSAALIAVALAVALAAVVAVYVLGPGALQLNLK